MQFIADCNATLLPLGGRMWNWVRLPIRNPDFHQSPRLPLYKEKLRNLVKLQKNLHYSHERWRAKVYIITIINLIHLTVSRFAFFKSPTPEWVVGGEEIIADGKFCQLVCSLIVLAYLEVGAAYCIPRRFEQTETDRRPQAWLFRGIARAQHSHQEGIGEVSWCQYQLWTDGHAGAAWSAGTARRIHRLAWLISPLCLSSYLFHCRIVWLLLSYHLLK